MDARKSSTMGSASKASRPWGQALLRAKAQEMLLKGALAPSAVMGNLLAAAAAPVVDAEMLSAPPRPMSVEANRVIADALRRSRLPHADVGAILDELVELAWQPKAPPFEARAVHGAARLPVPKKAASHGKQPARSGPKVAGSAAPKPRAPVIVRRGQKLSGRPD